MKRASFSLAAPLASSLAGHSAAERSRSGTLILLAGDSGFADASCCGGETATPKCNSASLLPGEHHLDALTLCNVPMSPP